VNEQQARSYLRDANVRAFLRALRVGETDADLDEAYTALFGWKPGNGKTFSDFTSHPNVRTYETHDGQFIKNGRIDFTTAAGAYQIVQSTWAGLQRKYTWLRTFSPELQDLAAICLIHDRGAMEDVLAGRIVQAIGKLGDEWASLPSATVGQPTVAMGKVLGVYTRHGGHLMTPAPAEAPEATTPAPAPEPRQEYPIPAVDEYIAPRPDQEPYVAPQPDWPSAVPTYTAPALPAPKEKPKMAFPLALVAGLLPSVIELIPPLTKIFKPGSAVAERNVAAASAVLDTVVKATNAVNAQDAIEKMKSDPAALAAATREVTAWVEIVEAGGGGIDGARKADAAMVHSDGPWWIFLRSPSFWMLLLSLPLVYIVVGSIAGLWGHADWSSDVRASLATAVVSLIVGGAAGYFWGQTTSRNRTPGP
jgi:muramidase (phage lysozyme)